MLNRRGFTLAELLIALVLFGIVSTAIYQVLVNNQRLYRQQTQRIELTDNIRSATAILQTDLRELNAADPLGSDIVEMTDSSLTYKAMRSLYVTCQPVSGGTVILDTTMIGLRGLDAEFDSLLVLADLNTQLASDDVWRHVNVTAVQRSTSCPSGQPSINVSVSPSIAGTDSALAGYPVRGFEVVDVRRYADASGAIWLGSRRYSKSTGWSALQPAVGPLATGGLRFTYFARDGSITSNRSLVARIGITVVGRTSQPVRLNDRTTGYLTDSLTTYVALRNNR